MFDTITFVLRAQWLRLFHLIALITFAFACVELYDSEINLFR